MSENVAYGIARVMWPCCPWLFQTQKVQLFRFWHCVAAEWYILQQLWLNSSPAASVWKSELEVPCDEHNGTTFNPRTPTVIATMHSITDRWPDYAKSQSYCLQRH